APEDDPDATLKPSRTRQPLRPRQPTHVQNRPAAKTQITKKPSAAAAKAWRLAIRVTLGVVALAVVGGGGWMLLRAFLDTHVKSALKKQDYQAALKWSKAAYVPGKMRKEWRTRAGEEWLKAVKEQLKPGDYAEALKQLREIQAEFADDEKLVGECDKE